MMGRRGVNCFAEWLYLDELGEVAFEHTTLTINEERHLRLVYYAHKGGDSEARAFNKWEMG